MVKETYRLVVVKSFNVNKDVLNRHELVTTTPFCKNRDSG